MVLGEKGMVIHVVNISFSHIEKCDVHQLRASVHLVQEEMAAELH